MSLSRTISVKTEQTYLIAHFMKNVIDTSIKHESNDPPSIAGKRIAHVRAKLQSMVADKFLSSIAFSNYHGFVNDLTKYIQERVNVIIRNSEKLLSVNELNNLFIRHNAGKGAQRFIFTIDGIKSYFAVDYGFNGVLIYQISTYGNTNTNGLSGYIEDIFQVDWDVENPTNLDSWLSLVRGNSIPTKFTLTSYLNEHSYSLSEHLVTYERFEKHFCREIMRTGMLDIGTTVRQALGMRNEFIGIHPDSLERHNRGLNSFLDTMSFKKVAEMFNIADIYNAIENMLVENAPVMTEAAFFEQWENKEQFDRLDTVIVGLRENMVSYVYKVKDTDTYLWIDIVNKLFISKVNILSPGDINYLGLAFTNIDSPEVLEFMETHGFKFQPVN